MDRYQRVEKPRPETPINENEIRITTQGKMRNYITYATTLLQVILAVLAGSLLRSEIANFPLLWKQLQGEPDPRSSDYAIRGIPDQALDSSATITQFLPLLMGASPTCQSCFPFPDPCIFRGISHS